MRIASFVVLVSVVIGVAGCSTKKSGDHLRNDESPSAGAAFDWFRLNPEDAGRFGGQPVKVSESPPSSMTAKPLDAEGTFSFGELRLGVGERGRIPFALQEFPVPLDGSEPREWKLYLDRDLDGDLAEEAPLTAAAKPLGGEQKGVRAASFRGVDLVLPGGARYSVYTNALRGSGAAVLIARPACALETAVTLGDKTTGVTLYDANANGVFGDMTEAADRMGDAVWIDLDTNGIRGKTEVRPLSPRLLYGQRVLDIRLGGFPIAIEVTEAEGVEFGTVARAGAAEGEELAVQLFSKDFGLMQPASGEYPAGAYNLLSYQIKRTDDAGVLWSVAGAWMPADAPSVEISSGRSAGLAFGPPFEASVWFRYGEGEGPGSKAMIVAMLRGTGRENAVIAHKKGLAALGGYAVTTADGKELGAGDFTLMPQFPGVSGAYWSVPEGVEKGTELTLTVSPKLGPFTEGFERTSTFEFGKSTPVQLVVSSVDPGTQAESVGMRPGDVIVSYDGKELLNPVEDLARAMRDAAGKSKVELVIGRDGRRVTLEVKPGRLGVQTGLAMP